LPQRKRKTKTKTKNKTKTKKIKKQKQQKQQNNKKASTFAQGRKAVEETIYEKRKRKSVLE